jgi:hypothetical protein
MFENLDYLKKNQRYIIFFIFINFAYFGLNIGKNDKFKTLISFYGSLSIFISVYSLLMQINQSKLNRISNDIVYINKIFSDIDNDIYSFFSKNESMKYYYYELYEQNSDYKEENRNKELEKLFTFKILSNAETLINYIDALKSANSKTEQINIAETKLKKLLKNLLKSKIFVENWKQYSKIIAMDWTKDYFDLYFNN